MIADIIAVNRERWDAMASANVLFSRPFFNFTREEAAAYVRCDTVLGEVDGKAVLCLASGGGQDSAAFGLLGANVTVFDLSDVQLSRDQEAARHHGYPVQTVQGDMRDLSIFDANTFDIVWQPYSINYSPTVEPVIAEVSRVLKPSGIYHLAFANPFVLAMDNDWDGNGYPLRDLYRDGEDITRFFPAWEFTQDDGTVITVAHPHEFRHTLSTLFNTLARQGFLFLQMSEWMRPDADPEQGSWAHFTQCCPPYLQTFWRLGAA
ncbi:MAG TPA: class I SAM-dependent methyltransferase [Armatimonadota bacterium]|nr:class I SAM-dependent methyltransferase [Armatimonadota bacterium]